MKRSSWWDYSDVKVVKSWLIKEVLLASNDAARLIDVPVHGQPDSYLMELSIKGLKLWHEMVRGVYPETEISVDFPHAIFEAMRLDVMIEDGKLDYVLTYEKGGRRYELPTPPFRKWSELVENVEDLWGFTSRGFVCYENGSPKPVVLDQGILDKLDSGITWVPGIREFVRKR